MINEDEFRYNLDSTISIAYNDDIMLIIDIINLVIISIIHVNFQIAFSIFVKFIQFDFKSINHSI